MFYAVKLIWVKEVFRPTDQKSFNYKMYVFNLNKTTDRKPERVRCRGKRNLQRVKRLDL